MRPRAPFDFGATARFFRFTEAEIVDHFDAGTYARALHVNDKLRLLAVKSEGTRSRPRLSVALSTPCPPPGGGARDESADAERIAGRMFSVDHDLGKFRERVAGDPLMARLEAAHRGLRLPRWPTLFEALANSILLQQIATPVAWTFRRRLVERFGETLAVGGREFYAFPLPASLAPSRPEELRTLGLTGAKSRALVELARAVDSGALDGEALAREDDEAIISRLTQLRGVGRWTAEWVLMLHFGRADVYAAADLFLRGAVAKYYNGGRAMSEREVGEFARARWAGWRSYAALYLLAGMRAGSVTLRP